ncbi:MAG: low molecular weight phosphotyrosine protein phosphatase [Ruminococcaceae bacterium]|nr:low molecular weight phosphotyrosine protein phosphatase [Oscillospiraceae bacterium]
MVRILFICHGNICRSPMAEFVFKDIAEKKGIGYKFYVASAATSYEEIGNPVHRGTARILDALGISYSEKRAIHLEKSDYTKYDYLVCMDSLNVRNTLHIVGDDAKKKIHKLLEFAGSCEDVADPWYTGDFNRTYKDVLSGCKGLLSYIEERQKS